jgi:DNA-binding NarL/FixJ family response regulator
MHIVGEASDGRSGVEIIRRLVPDVVLMDPDHYKVPTDPATRYALAGALAARANEENAGRFFKAISRLPQEFGIMAVRDAFARNEDLANVREFTEWVTENQEVLL